MKTYEKEGRILPYEILYKPIKNTYFRIKNGHLVITTHRMTPKPLILSYIDRKFDAFYKQFSKEKTDESDDIIMLGGKTYDLFVTQGRFRFQIDEASVWVRSMSENISEIKKRIYLETLKETLGTILPEVEAKVSSYGITRRPIKLKYLKSKYGSYHRKHMEITLNTFLARLDPIYVTYVLYHEYAHAKVFDHSQSFYALLSEFMPNHREYQKALKTYVIS